MFVNIIKIVPLFKKIGKLIFLSIISCSWSFIFYVTMSWYGIYVLWNVSNSCLNYLQVFDCMVALCRFKWCFCCPTYSFLCSVLQIITVVVILSFFFQPFIVCLSSFLGFLLALCEIHCLCWLYEEFEDVSKGYSES